MVRGDICVLENPSSETPGVELLSEEVTMRATRSFLLTWFGLFIAGCASLSPEKEARHALFWEAAKECQAHYRTIRVRHIDSINKVIHFEDYAQAEADEFMACFNERAWEKITGVPAVTEETAKGASVPERESVMPTDIGPSERKNLPF